MTSGAFSSRNGGAVLVAQLTGTLLLMACCSEAASPRVCIQYINLSDDTGHLLAVSESDTRCDAVTGLLHYSWEIAPNAEIYRQIDVRCYDHEDPGAWTIIQPRAFNNSDGSASYSIPTHLLDNDITITSCSIQGCYNKDEQFTEYLTNRVIVNCSIDLPITSYSVSTTPALLPSPTTPLAVSPTQTQDAVFSTYSSALSSSPVERTGRPTGQEGALDPTSRLVISLVPASIFLGIIVFIIPVIICYIKLRSNRNLIEEIFINEENQFDPTLKPPPFGPISGQMKTPYPSQHSLCDDQTRHDLPTLDYGLCRRSTSLAAPSNSESSSGYHRVKQDTVANLDTPSPDSQSQYNSDGPINDEGERIHASGTELTHIDIWDKIGMDGSVMQVEADAPIDVFVTDRLEEREGRGVDGMTMDKVEDDFTTHFTFCEFPSILGSSDDSQHSWSQPQTSSSGYVTDSSCLLSPDGLKGVPKHTTHPQQQQREKFTSRLQSNDTQHGVPTDSLTIGGGGGDEDVRETLSHPPPVEGSHSVLFDAESALESTVDGVAESCALQQGRQREASPHSSSPSQWRDILQH